MSGTPPGQVDMNATGMRITAGRFRGRRLPVPEIAGVRPTPSKVRQALFNILGGIEGATMLDLFSGSGLMALEAISRGASVAISIESNWRAVRHLQDMRERWTIEDCWELLHGDVHAMLARLAGRHFDLVFADPPYAQAISVCVPRWLDEAQVSCAQLVIEESARVSTAWPSGWTQRQLRHYGGTCLYFLTRTGAS